MKNWEGFYQFQRALHDILEIPLRQGFSITKQEKKLTFIWELNPKKAHQGLQVNDDQVVFSPNITIESYEDNLVKLMINGIGGVYTRIENAIQNEEEEIVAT